MTVCYAVALIFFGFSASSESLRMAIAVAIAAHRSLGDSLSWISTSIQGTHLPTCRLDFERIDLAREETAVVVSQDMSKEVQEHSELVANVYGRGLSCPSHLNVHRILTKQSQRYRVPRKLPLIG